MGILKRLIKEETGTILTPEFLIILMGGVVVSGIVLRAVMSPLTALHKGSVENITKITRGY